MHPSRRPRQPLRREPLSPIRRRRLPSGITVPVLVLVATRAVAAEPDGGSTPTTLDEVRVTAPAIVDAPLHLSTPTTAGALGTRSVLDTPFSVTVVDSNEILERGARSINQLFANDAAISTGTNSYTTDWWGTQIRGMPVRNHFIDGVPMLLYWGGDFPLEISENVTALKGLSGFMYGFGTPGGALSYALKRPKATDETTVYLGWRNPGLVSLHVDSSYRLSDDLAVRANLATERGTAYNDSRIDRTVASLAVDKRFRGAVNWFSTFAYESNRTRGEPFLFSDFEGYDVIGSGGRLPRPTYRYQDFDVDNAGYRSRSLFASTGVDWKVNENWQFRYQLGMARKTHWSNKAFASLLNEAGDYQGWSYNFAGRLDTLFTQALVQGKVSTGPINHEVVAGVGLQRSRDRWSNEFYYENDFNGNLYTPQTFRVSRTPDYRLAPVSSDVRETYGFVSDTIDLGPQWQVIGGLRYSNYRSTDPSDAEAEAYKTDRASPTVALIYRPTPTTRLYASYVEGLEPGTRVGPLYANAGDVLGATVSKQYEVGTKHESGRLGVAAALFRVELANQMDRRVGDLRYLTQDGLNIYEGAELSTAWQVDPALGVGLSAVYLRARIDKVSEDNADIAGKVPPNAPKWQAVVNARYRVPGLERLKLHGNVHYYGAAWATQANNLEVPGRTLVNAGFSFDFTVQGRELTLIGNVYNLFDRKYWALTDWSRGNIGEGRNYSLAVLGRF